MILYELTREQQTFAEENHNLVYAFLRDKKLREDDYYDVIVFGYLCAVQEYCDRMELRRKFAFSTIAWRKMTDKLVEHYKRQSRSTQRAVTVSLEAMIGRNEWLTVAEIVPDTQDMMSKLEAGILWDEISGVLNNEQIEIIRMKATGYNIREIAASQKRRQSDIENMLSEIKTVVLGLCLA